MANLTAQQRYGLGAAPAGSPKPMGGLAQKRKTKAVTVTGKPKKFAMGGAITPVGGVLGSVLRPSATSPTVRPSAAAGNRMIQKYADGGKVEIPRIEVTAKRMTPEEAKAYDEKESKGNEGMGRDTNPDASTSAPEAVEASRKKNVEREIHRTINGAPIRNLHPANLPVGSGGVRG